MAPGIRDIELLQFLGVILGREVQSSAMEEIRSRLMRPGLAWQSLIDLLVRNEDSAPAIAALKSVGYQSGPVEVLNHHHFPAMQHRDEPVGVEIHTHALSVAGQKIMSTEHIWKHAAGSQTGSFLMMSRRWHALHCLLHHQISDHGYAWR